MDKMLLIIFGLIVATVPSGLILWFGRAYLQTVIRKMDELILSIKDLTNRQNEHDVRYEMCQRLNAQTYAKQTDVKEIEQTVDQNTLDIVKLCERMKQG